MPGYRLGYSKAAFKRATFASYVLGDNGTVVKHTHICPVKDREDPQRPPQWSGTEEETFVSELRPCSIDGKRIEKDPALMLINTRY